MQNGKGSRRRPGNTGAYLNNYDQINWGRPKKQNKPEANKSKSTKKP